MSGLADRALVYTLFISIPTIGYLATFPFFSTIVKYRSNYSPKRIELDQEENRSHSVAGVSSYFAMMKRVKQLEGRAGFYKGIVPCSLLLALLLSIPVLIRAGIIVTRKRDLWQSLAVSLFSEIIVLPIRVIIFRYESPELLIVSLPWYNPVFSLRILLSVTERKHPWLLFLTPGLLVSVVLSIVHGTLVMSLLNTLTFTVATRYPLARSSPTQLGIYLVASIVSVLISCPLSVVQIRLSIQRNHPPRDYEIIEQEGQAESSGVAYSGAEEDVVSLRSEGDPYKGFFDCIRRIVNEEGYSRLLCAWWFDLMFLWYSGFMMPWLQSFL
ncbi:hypothetical protein A7U60_g4341 [Sanghuangporus baumii]|uniref:Uncharacterized protein n=1 Tax=Sanghuangporus baumii TaxID=108892 RepID=A0A9Q5HYT3_SANBA|nr:hypothetical protein A7U60_g4341 [Sanghuangporus baumii]